MSHRPTIIGCVIPFGARYRETGEYHRRGAFSITGSMRCLISHCSALEIASTADGTMRVWEDDMGVWASVTPWESGLATLLYSAMARGKFLGFSLGGMARFRRVRGEPEGHGGVLHEVSMAWSPMCPKAFAKLATPYTGPIIPNAYEQLLNLIREYSSSK